MYATRNLSTSRAILAVAALAIALGFAGCKSAPATPTDDAGLTAALQSRIAGDAALSNEPIQSSVQKQVATLNGTVSNEAARSLAAADAAQVPGVKTVVNNLTVQAPAPAVTAAAAPPPLPPPPTPVAPKPKPPAPIKSKPATIVRQPAPVETPAPQVATAAQAGTATASTKATRARLPQHHPQPGNHPPHPHHPNPRQRHHATG